MNLYDVVLHFKVSDTLNKSWTVEHEKVYTVGLWLRGPEHTLSHMCSHSGTHFVWGWAQTRGGPYSSLSFDCGKTSLALKENVQQDLFFSFFFLYCFHDSQNSTPVKCESFLKPLLIAGGDFEHSLTIILADIVWDCPKTHTHSLDFLQPSGPKPLMRACLDN